MANYINKYTNIEAYNADDGKQYPNVSYLVATDEVKWVKDDPVHIVCKYNVTSTESATKLLNRYTNISYQIIDGVRQDTVQMNYTFDTLGEHTVKYKLSGIIIYEWLFLDCINLSSVVLTSNITEIRDAALANCTALKKVVAQNTLTSIKRDAFRNSNNLTNITILAETPPVLEGSTVFDNTNNCPIYVPAESVDAYKAATNWSSLASRIKPISE